MHHSVRRSVPLALMLAGVGCTGKMGPGSGAGADQGTAGGGGDVMGGGGDAGNDTGGVGSGGNDQAGTGGSGGGSGASGTGGQAGTNPQAGAGGTASMGGTMGAGGMAGAGGAAGTAMNPRPSGLHTKAYTCGLLSGDINVFDINMADGTFKALGTPVPAGNQPDFLAFHPNGKFLYAANSGAPSSIAAFSINPTTGGVTKLTTDGEAATAPGDGPRHLSVHKSGKWIFAAHFVSGHVTVHPILANGGVGAPVASAVACPEARHAITDLDGKYLFVSCRKANQVAQYKFDEMSGALTPNTPAKIDAPVANTFPREIAFHPNKKWAYLLGERSFQLVTYRLDSATGTLVEPFSVSTLPPSGSETAANRLVLDPDGRFAYVSLYTLSALAILSIDPQTGRPTLVGHEMSSIHLAEDFSIDPTGKILILVNGGYNQWVDFAINPTTGLLTFEKTERAAVHHPVFAGALNFP